MGSPQVASVRQRSSEHTGNNCRVILPTMRWRSVQPFPSLVSLWHILFALFLEMESREVLLPQGRQYLAVFNKVLLEEL